ncbi:hypothetical protein SAMN04487891_10242 [Flagellimonas taeanensis]|uniref:Uncharacterized protein n=1 Tax=Flagellimonas taeanensis TaxID=1005926 RepID=A0A1M6RDA2_9FLAO|nr:hypothetical protein SAMN04487891_10242 [Allomuricauda taeanensis]SHK30423.1 hypothetical protein SAMN05216293_0717 [Allomuricauda taeanensis]
MKENSFTQVILEKIRRFFRPMFYNGRNGQVKEAQKTGKDLPWFI